MTNKPYNKRRSKKRVKRERIPVRIHKLNSKKPLLQKTIDYKNLKLLRQFISTEGKILPRRLTLLTAKEQRNMANAIKTARVAGLLPFINQ